MNRKADFRLSTAIRKAAVGGLLTLIVAISGINQAQAQDNDKLRGGIKGGVNYSNFYTSEVDDKNAKLGFHIGGFVKAPITSFLAIQPELMYSLQGSEVMYKPILLGTPHKIRYNLSYVNLPVLVVVNPHKNFNLHAGPYVGALLGVKRKDVDADGSTDYAKDFDRDDFTTLDYGLSGGLGFDFEGGTIGLRYNYGMNRVGKDNSSSLAEALKNSKNSVVQLYAGFAF